MGVWVRLIYCVFYIGNFNRMDMRSNFAMRLRAMIKRGSCVVCGQCGYALSLRYRSVTLIFKPGLGIYSLGTIF